MTERGSRTAHGQPTTRAVPEVIWSHARVANELLCLAHEFGCEHFPPQRIIRARSRSLLRSVQATGGSRARARRLGLEPWPQGRRWVS